VAVNIDPETSMLFDNQYYRNLLDRKVLFDDSTRKLVEDFANDQELFFDNWGVSFVKLTSIGVKTEEGEIRRSCAATNIV
jgi:peroxidase